MPAMGMFLLGLLLLLLGGDSLLKCASGLAQRFGLSPFGSGLLLLAFGTSLPALAVSAYAWHEGATELALGNAIGGNLGSLGLTLGLAALVAPVLARMRLLAGALVFVLVAAGMLLLFGLDGRLERWEGALFLAGFVGYLAFAASCARGESPEIRQELASFAVTATGLAQNLLRLVFAVALLYFGSRWLVQSAPPLGSALGLNSPATGLTLLALGSTLPSLAIAALAAFNGQGNVVAGHVLGACLFNLLLVVGGMALAGPLPLPAALVTLPLPATMAFALLMYPLFGGELRLGRRGGALLLLAFLAWLAVELFAALH